VLSDLIRLLADIYKYCGISGSLHRVISNKTIQIANKYQHVTLEVSQANISIQVRVIPCDTTVRI